MHFLSDKSAGPCLIKKNCNTMRTGGRYSEGNLFFTLQIRLSMDEHPQSRERAKLMGGARARAL